MSESGSSVVAKFRFLEPDEGGVLSEAIKAAYGDSYDVRWVYDTAEVSARLAAGTYVACVAETEDGELLCHEGMSLGAAGDAVGHSGQAVTMPAARGQHLFTRTKRFLMDWAREKGLAGMYSEATAAHPYSQRANIELGAHETGFLLGWIPASVSNDAGRPPRPPVGGVLLRQAQ
jgi:GNAT superfamily N-acetyltransferase